MTTKETVDLIRMDNRHILSLKLQKFESMLKIMDFLIFMVYDVNKSNTYI